VVSAAALRCTGSQTERDTGPGAHPASCIICNGSFQGYRRPERWADLPQSSAEVQERVELYLYSP